MEMNNDKEKHVDQPIYIDKGPFIGMRHVQITLTLLFMTVGFATRSSLAVLIVAMTTNGTSSNKDIEVYDWKNTSVILSSIYWGLCIFPIVSGYLLKYYGPKWFMLGSMALNSAAYSLVPLSAKYFGSYGVMACRILQGVSQSFFSPGSHTVLGKWAPENERSKLGTIVYAGVSGGTIISTIVCGYISASSWGWPWGFYLFGILGFAWCALWLFFGYNDPSSHPTITPEETNYIESSLYDGLVINESPPWKAIFLSIPFWAVIFGCIGSNWGLNTVSTEMPTYLSKAMGYDMASNSVLSAIPYIASVILGLVFGQIADFLIENNYLSTLNTRRLFQCVGNFVPALALVILGYISSDHSSIAVTLLVIAMGASSGNYCGSSISHIDLSPKYAGILIGITNCISQGIAILGPLMVQIIVTNKADISQWRIAFMIAAAAYAIGSALFIIYASGDRQPWDGSLQQDESIKQETKAETPRESKRREMKERKISRISAFEMQID